MRLSGAVIARDEQGTLARCIHSLANLVDEIVVVDTGSSDGSIQIARSMGASVRHYAWDDDFSSARNFALSQLSGDWVLFLDADEQIVVDPVWLRRYLINETRDALLCSLYNLSDDGEVVYSRGSVICVFRLGPGMRYVRPIHEYLMNGPNPITHADCRSQIRVYHTGYSPEAVAAKHKYHRNRTMLLRELRRDKTSSDLHYYLAETYLLGHQMKKAIRSFERALSLDRFVHVGVAWARIRRLLAMIKSGLYSDHALLEEVARELSRNPNSPELWAYKGMLLAGTDRSEESRECLAKGQELYDLGRTDSALFENIKYEVLQALEDAASSSGS